MKRNPRSAIRLAKALCFISIAGQFITIAALVGNVSHLRFFASLVVVGINIFALEMLHRSEAMVADVERFRLEMSETPLARERRQIADELEGVQKREKVLRGLLAEIDKGGKR